MIDRALEFARDTLGSHAVYGISLTNHTVSQKVVARRGFRDVGMEIDYVPQRMLVQDGAAGPTATLVTYLDYGRHGYGARSEERRVGKECGTTVKSRRSH